MSAENFNNGLGEQDSQPIDGSSNLNVPVVLDEFDEFEPIDFGLGNESNSSTEHNNQSVDSEKSEQENELEENDNLIDFGLDSEIEKEQKPLDLSDDELIKKLQEKGFEVRKNETPNPTDQYHQERARLEENISQIDSALNASNDQLILSKLRNDLVDQYEKTGRKNEIGTSEFNEEIQDQLDEMNDITRRIFAENVREKLERMKSDSSNRLSLINQNEESRINQIVEKNLNELNTSLTKIHKEGNFLGIPITEKDLREVHAEITSGNLSKVLSSSQETIAQVALFFRFKDQIMNSLNGATYGEGVKAAVDALKNGQQSGSRSPLAKIIEQSERTGGSEGKKSFENHWGPEVVQSPQDQKPKHVAGSGGIL